MRPSTGAEWKAPQNFFSIRQQLLAKDLDSIDPGSIPGRPPSDVPDPSSGSACSSTTGRVAVGDLAAADAAASTNSSRVAEYAPIIIGLLGANLAILLVLVFLGVMAFVRRNRQTGLARTPGAQYVPAQVKDESLLVLSFDEEKQYSDG
ncbi:hypothetical protein DFH09DRAFT_1323254 [Mycena vulgaris]|nr:hypothetical protein DFH09DRAFT_1323254 [Mycena vulgaris]